MLTNKKSLCMQYLKWPFWIQCYLWWLASQISRWHCHFKFHKKVNYHCPNFHSCKLSSCNHSLITSTSAPNVVYWWHASQTYRWHCHLKFHKKVNYHCPIHLPDFICDLYTSLLNVNFMLKLIKWWNII